MKITRSQLKQLIWESFTDRERKHFGPTITRLMDNPEKADSRLYPELPGWLEENIGDNIGAGSYRGVYEINGRPGLVAKVAHIDIGNDSGVKYNKKEIDLFNRYTKIFPKVYVHDPEFRWLIVENTPPIHTPYGLGEAVISSFKSMQRLSQEFNRYSDNTTGNISLIGSIFMTFLPDDINYDDWTIEEIVNDGLNTVTNYMFANNSHVTGMLESIGLESIKSLILNCPDMQLLLHVMSENDINDLGYGNIGRSLEDGRFVIIDGGVEGAY